MCDHDYEVEFVQRPGGEPESGPSDNLVIERITASSMRDARCVASAMCADEYEGYAVGNISRID
jgi:hypothetical protein